MKQLIFALLVLCIFNALLCAKQVIINPYTERAISINLLESREDVTLVEVILNHYNNEYIQIEGKDYVKLFVETGGVRSLKGEPELPIIATSLVIPPQAQMHVAILDTQYTDFDGHIIPSKGDLPRKINPLDIPFSFSDIYHQNSLYPAELVELNDPYIMREIRGISLHISPFQYNPVLGKIRCYERILLKVYAEGLDTTNSLLSRTSRITSDFIDLYESHFLNFHQINARYTPIIEEGAVLVIAHPSFMEAIQPYVDWKTQKGIRTELVSTSTTGTTVSSIKNFISTRWMENPHLAYVQLVGDAAQIPSLNVSVPSLGSGASDPDYVMLLGDDYYPELFIGRFSGATSDEIATQVQRTIYYERDLNDTDTWLSQAIGIAGTDGGAGGHYNQSDIMHMDTIRSLLLTGTYSNVDQQYQPTATVSSISEFFNAGRGLANYISHGNISSWDFIGSGAISYSNTNVNNLTNSNKLPFIVSVACQNGNFVNYTCFAETWLRATHSITGEPTGAIAFYGSSNDQTWQAPMYAQDHIAELIVSEIKNTVGGLFFNGSSYMLDLQPGISTGIGTMQTWNIFGDASLMVRTKKPLAMNVVAENMISSSTVEYTVDTAVPGARVALYGINNKVLYASSLVGDNGNTVLSITEPLTEDAGLILTVTAFNRTTFISPISVFTVSPPNLMVEPDTHNFGSVFIGVSSPEKTFLITNTGGNTITIENISDFLTDEFELTTSDILDFPILLDSGESITIGVRFSPLIEGPKTGEITITFNTLNSPIIIELYGEGIKQVFNPPRELSIERIPTALSHGVPLLISWLEPAEGSSGDLSHYRLFRNDEFIDDIECNNYQDEVDSDDEYIYCLYAVYANLEGESEGIENSIIISPFNPPRELEAIAGEMVISLTWESPQAQQYGELQEYIVWRNSNEEQNFVMLGEHIPSELKTYCDYNVQAGFLYTYYITAQYDNPYGISLPSNYETATIISPLILTVEPNIHHFGIVFIGQHSIPQDFILTNEGDRDLVITTVNITDSTNFHLYYQDLPLTLSIGDTTILSVDFSPQSVDNYEAVLDICTNSDESLASIILAGIGVESPVFSIDPTSYNFGSTIIGDSSPEQSFIITNTGGSILTIETISDFLSDEFKFTTPEMINFPIYLESGESISLKVIFTPLINGPKIEELIIFHNAYNSPSIVELIGEGINKVFNPPMDLSIERILTTTSLDVSLLLSWVEPTDGSSGILSHYRLLRNDEWIIDTEYNTYEDNVDSDFEYTYRVSAIYVNLDGESEGIENSIIISPFNPPRDLQAVANETAIVLTWEAPQTQQYGLFQEYQIWRNSHQEPDFSLLNVQNPIDYTTYCDSNVQYGVIYTYYIIATYSSPIGNSLPSNNATEGLTLSIVDEPFPVWKTELLGNYPNPFNPKTVISFSVDKTTNVILDIYNIKGQKIKSLLNREYSPGKYSVIWDGTDDHYRTVGSGLFFCKLHTESIISLKSMLLLK